jgi:SAM-dependent methyltransferase
MIPCNGYDKAADLYDLFDTKPNIDFFMHYASQAGEILDIGAGTGRIAIPIAEKGFRVVCVEPSGAMRRVFESKLVRKQAIRDRITIIEGDAASFNLGRSYPTAFMSGSFDHLLDDPERKQALANIGRHLIAGGRLVFDVFTGLMTDSPIKPAGEVRIGDVTYRRLVGRRIMPGQVIELTLVYETRRKSKLIERVEQESVAGITDRARVHEILDGAGFRVDREFGDYGFTPYDEGGDLLIVEAARVT